MYLFSYKVNIPNLIEIAVHTTTYGGYTQCFQLVHENINVLHLLYTTCDLEQYVYNYMLSNKYHSKGKRIMGHFINLNSDMYGTVSFRINL